MWKGEFRGQLSEQITSALKAASTKAEEGDGEDGCQEFRILLLDKIRFRDNSALYDIQAILAGNNIHLEARHRKSLILKNDSLNEL